MTSRLPGGRGADILLVEDQWAVAAPLRDRLEAEGHTVTRVEDGEAALRRFRRGAFDLVILDLMLPGRLDGFEVARELRAGLAPGEVGVPILMVTARAEVEDRVAGLRMGADDYLVKPFSMAELVARVDALLRRASGRPTATGVVRFGRATVDLDAGTVEVEGRPVDLPAREYQLLRYFLAHPRRSLSRDLLLREVWGYARRPDSRTVDTHVGRLRERFEPDRGRPVHFITLRGVGYRFEP